MVSKEATVVFRGEVLVKGKNQWICMPDDNVLMCNDATWMAMMKAVGDKAPFSTTKMGFSYMLQGDSGVSNSDPYHPNHKAAKDYIKEGPHLMIIVPKELLMGITDDPHVDGPYVMWKDTSYAHIMIPIAKRE
ncbi:MAG: hypothetical protein HRU20_08715 [Pseudomonadales bacterium]|nr:hypothetical protein [Pseudomonadales bacterium]